MVAFWTRLRILELTTAQRDAVITGGASASKEYRWTEIRQPNSLVSFHLKFPIRPPRDHHDYLSKSRIRPRSMFKHLSAAWKARWGQFPCQLSQPRWLASTANKGHAVLTWPSLTRFRGMNKTERRGQNAIHVLKNLEAGYSEKIVAN